MRACFLCINGLKTCTEPIKNRKILFLQSINCWKYLQGKQKQAKRTQTFFQFCNAKDSILLCTDVAARGLDIPQVDWIVQFDPPDDPKVYIFFLCIYLCSTFFYGICLKKMEFCIAHDLFCSSLKFDLINPQEYIHRVGRTARGEGGVGHALLILRPEELGFLRYLKQARVPLNEFEFSWSKIANIQPQVCIFYKKNSVFLLSLFFL